MRNFSTVLRSLIICTLFLIPAALHSQSVSLMPGDSIRWIEQGYPYWFYGRVVGYRNDTLLIQQQSKNSAIPVKRIQKLQVATRWHTNGWKGAGIGAAIGTGLVAALAWSEGSHSDHSFFKITPGIALLEGVIVGGIPAAALGGIIGHGIRSVDWKEIPQSQISSLKMLHQTSGQHKPDTLHPAKAKVQKEVPKHPQKAASNTNKPKERQPLRLEKNKSPEVRDFDLSILLAFPKNSAIGEIENQMNISGFGDDYHGWFGPTLFPHSDAAYGFIVSFKRRLKKKFDIGLQAGQFNLGKTYGYDTQSSSYLTVASSALFVNPMLYFKSRVPFQFGFGPAIYALSVDQVAMESFTKHQSQTLPGAVAEMDVTFPRNTNLFVNLKLQARLIPSTTIGPYMTIAEENRTIFPKTKVNYSMFLLALGFGFGE